MRYLVTGAAGFIGSHLVGRLLADGHEVVALDNLSTGHAENLKSFQQLTGFHLVYADAATWALTERFDAVFHQAALGSIPRSLQEPQITFHNNVTAFWRILDQAYEYGCRRFIYASSSSVYGDDTPTKYERLELTLPGNPYAASKYCNEVIAEAYRQSKSMEVIGLRYFNVFGPRQKPDGPYAAVIPKWIKNMIDKKPCEIYGDGCQVRDFTPVELVVEANIKAASVDYESLPDGPPVFNISGGNPIKIKHLHTLLSELTGNVIPPVYLPARNGDRKASIAKTERAALFLGIMPGDTSKALSELVEEMYECYGKSKTGTTLSVQV